jgi:hypothetical protein
MNRKTGQAFRQVQQRPLQTILFGILILSLVVLARPAVEGQTQGTGPIIPAARVEQAPLDQPLSWLYEAKRNYAAVKDYSCTLVSQENVRGKLQDQNVMQLKVKTQPFSVYMRWLAPKQNQGQEVAFVVGKNNGKMRVKSNVIGNKLIGFVPIDPNDPRVLEHSRHSILEAGIGNMIDQTITYWELDRKVGKTQVKVADFSYNQRECLRVETIHTERRPDAYSYRCRIFLEKNSKMPIRLENYDWPQPGGNPDGEILEIFSYVNLQFNTGLKDEEFNK